MKIAVIAWGSLCWDKRNLNVVTNWNNNGVILPIEFSRISKDGRLTLVITEKYGTELKTYWAISGINSIEKAIENLKEREGTNKNNIGFINLVENTSHSKFSNSLIEIIKKWAILIKVDAVIWTDLESNFFKKRNIEFSVDNAIEYLNQLEIKQKEKAMVYINKSPKQTITELRKRI